MYEIAFQWLFKYNLIDLTSFSSPCVDKTMKQKGSKHPLLNKPYGSVLMLSHKELLNSIQTLNQVALEFSSTLWDLGGFLQKGIFCPTSGGLCQLYIISITNSS
ncbi:hypothetical protein CsSME_00004059 [Camellia sinensis var. sinensis]